MIRAATLPAHADAFARFVATRDAEAFREVLEAYLPLVRSVCRRVLGRTGLADDAVQDTFLRLANRAETVRGNLGSWLYQTATNAAIDHRRSEASRRTREHSWSQEQQDHTTFESPPERDFLLEECLAELPSPQRDALVAYFWHGRTQQQIADHCGLSQVAIKKRIDRGLITLRIKLVRRGLDLVAPSRDRQTAGFVPLIVPVTPGDIMPLLGVGLIAALLLRPREAISHITEVSLITGGVVAHLLATTVLPSRASALQPAMREGFWVRLGRRCWSVGESAVDLTAWAGEGLMARRATARPGSSPHNG